MNELPPGTTVAADPDSQITVTQGVLCPWCDEWNETLNEGFCASCGLELAATKEPSSRPRPAPARHFRDGSLLVSTLAFSLAFALLFFGAKLSLRTAIAPAVLVGLVVRAMLLQKRITAGAAEEDDTNPDPP